MLCFFQRQGFTSPDTVFGESPLLRPLALIAALVLQFLYLPLCQSDQPGEWVQVRDYGAVGDGITDDTTALQRAIAAGRVILFDPPPNYYRVTAPLVVPSNRELRGVDQPLIYNDTANAVPVLLISGKGGETVENVRLDGLAIRNGQAVTGDPIRYKDGIVIEYARHVQIANCLITEIEGDYGLVTRYAADVAVRYNRFYRCTRSCFSVLVESQNIYVEHNIFDTVTSLTKPNTYLFMTGVEYQIHAGDYLCRNVHVRHNRFLNNPRWEGIDSHGGEGIFIEDNVVENTRVGIVVGLLNDLVVAPKLRNVSIVNNTIRQGSGEANHLGVYVRGSYDDENLLLAENVTIRGNDIVGYGSATSNTTGAITLAAVQNVLVEDNRIRDYRGIGICLYHTVQGATVRNNDIANCIADVSGGGRYGIRLRSWGLFDMLIEGNRIHYEDEAGRIDYGIATSTPWVHTQIRNNEIMARSPYRGIAYLPVGKNWPPVLLFARAGDVALGPEGQPRYRCVSEGLRASAMLNPEIRVTGLAGSHELTIAAGDFRKLPEGCAVRIEDAGAGGEALETVAIQVMPRRIVVRDALLENIESAALSLLDASWVVIPPAPEHVGTP